RERNDILRESLLGIFTDTRLRTYRHHDQHTFKVGLKVDDVRLEQGDIPLSVLVADEPADLTRRVEEARSDSRSNDHTNDVYWIFAVNAELDDLIAQFHASAQMIAKYNQVGAQGERTAEIGPLLEG